ncbi:uncharacterized protein LOC120333649 isoform X1 [Styela clava]
MAKKRCTWCRTNAVIRCVRDIPLSYGGVRPVDNCIQTAPTERVRCTAPGNFELCRKKGCHFCQNEKPKCIEAKEKGSSVVRYLGEVENLYWSLFTLRRSFQK